jgi:hypothetical protein
VARAFERARRGGTDRGERQIAVPVQQESAAAAMRPRRSAMESISMAGSR